MVDGPVGRLLTFGCGHLIPEAWEEAHRRRAHPALRRRAHRALPTTAGPRPRRAVGRGHHALPRWSCAAPPGKPLVSSFLHGSAARRRRAPGAAASSSAAAGPRQERLNALTPAIATAPHPTSSSISQSGPDHTRTQREHHAAHPSSSAPVRRYFVDRRNTASPIQPGLRRPGSAHSADQGQQLVDWLKADHGIGHGHATALVGYALSQRAAGGAPPRFAGYLLLEGKLMRKIIAGMFITLDGVVEAPEKWNPPQTTTTS